MRYASIGFTSRQVSLAAHNKKGILMMHIAKKMRRFLTSEDGPTAVEYAVMLALIVGVCLGAVTFLGTQTSGAFEESNTKITTAISGS